jgi:hypothetical protein
MNNLTQKVSILYHRWEEIKLMLSKINLISHLSYYLAIINITIIMLTKLWLQLSILLDHDDDDEYHPNRNAMKIENII